MPEFIQQLTFVFGLVTLGLSLSLMIYFAQLKHTLADAFAWMLLGEAIMGFVTVLFSLTSINPTGVTTLSPLTQTFMRWIAFTVASMTSLHLAKVIYDIQGSEL